MLIQPRSISVSSRHNIASEGKQLDFLSYYLGLVSDFLGAQ